ncbi:hypothetical protein [Streptomyces sp. NPDC003480]
MPPARGRHAPAAGGRKPGNARAKTVLGGIVLLCLIAMAVSWGGAVTHSSPRKEGGPETAFAAPVILDADRYGALVLDPRSATVVGVDEHGTVRWRDRNLAGSAEVSCLRRCPDAVGSGSAEGTGPSSTIWRIGSVRRVQAAAGLVLWADAPSDAIVARTVPGGTQVLEIRRSDRSWQYPLAGRDPQLFTARDRSRAVLLTFEGQQAHYRVLTRGPAGWTVSKPSRTAATSACLAGQRAPVVLYDANHAWLAPPGRGALRALPVTHVGRCSLTTDSILVQRFTDDTDHGPQTATRLLDTSGHVKWQRADPGLHPANADPDTGSIALPTDAGVLILSQAGGIVHRIPGAVDAQFTSAGCLVLLDSRLRVSRQCLHTGAPHSPDGRRDNRP